MPRSLHWVNTPVLLEALERYEPVLGFEVHVDVDDGEARQQLARASAVLAPLGAVDDGR